MKTPIPVTHLWLAEEPPAVYRTIFRTYAECGAKHLVLTDTLLKTALTDLPSVHKAYGELKEAGLDFLDAHAPFGRFCDLSLPIKEYRPVMLAQNRMILELCAAFGTKTCTIHVGNARYEQFYPLETFDDCTRDSLDKLLPYAEKCGIILNIENIWNQPSRPDLIVRMKQEFDTPWLGVCYDSGHANILRKAGRKDSTSAVYNSWGTEGKWGDIPWDDQVPEKIIPLAVTCHLHDNDGLQDRHALPFTGTIDWEKTARLLAAAPRLQCIQNEAITSKHGFTVAEACRTFEKFSSMVEAERNKPA